VRSEKFANQAAQRFELLLHAERVLSAGHGTLLSDVAFQRKMRAENPKYVA
jgi:hypothetical protein